MWGSLGVFFFFYFTLIGENIGNKWMKSGEGPILFKSNVEDKWYLFIDEYGLRGYIPLETKDLDSGEWKLPAEFSLPTHSLKQISILRWGSFCNLFKNSTEIIRIWIAYTLRDFSDREILFLCKQIFGVIYSHCC